MKPDASWQICGSEAHDDVIGVAHDDDLASGTTTLKVSRDAEALIAEHETAVTTVKVLPPVRDEISKDPIQAVVQITTVPENFPGSLATPESLMMFNQMAVLGALTIDAGQCFVGSRLTVFEREDAWTLYLPFLLFTTIAGSDAHLGALQAVFGNKERNRGESVWTEEDFSFVHSRLSEFCVCTGDGLGLTAEFGLRPGVRTAVLDGPRTALCL